MLRQRGGSIVNISSLASTLAAPGAVEYCTSKAAVSHLTTASSLELAPNNIRVNAIGPGTISTDMANAAYAEEGIQKTILSRTPMGRMGEADEIARTALFLASADSSYVTGKTLYVDGGRLGLNLCMPI
jgi:NAD(P)-dependent dehydrogenase (short-subunit alcohol dehydrogenase family)